MFRLGVRCGYQRNSSFNVGSNWFTRGVLSWNINRGWLFGPGYNPIASIIFMLSNASIQSQKGLKQVLENHVIIRALKKEIKLICVMHQSYRLKTHKYDYTSQY